MDREDLRELVPHYVATVAIGLLVLGAVRAVVGETDVLVDIAIIAVVVFTYRPVVRRLGLAPDLWERT